MTIDLLNEHIELGDIIDLKKLTNVEKRVLFILYFVDEKFGISELSTVQIHDLINQKLRMKTGISAIKMAISRSGDKISSLKKQGVTFHKIMTPGINEIKNLLKEKTEKEVLDFIIPNEVVKSEKDYFKKVIRQINGCYQDGYYDACFVMIRRAIETLIVDSFEHYDQEKDIQDADNNYLPFNKLIAKTLENKNIKLSKIAKTDLKVIKKFGDTAAHNRKVNLIKSDIDKHADSIRLIIEELIKNK